MAETKERWDRAINSEQMWQTNRADDAIRWRHCSRPTWSTLKSKSTSWPHAAAFAANCQNRADLYQHNSSLTLTSSLAAATPRHATTEGTPYATTLLAPSRKRHKRDEDKPFPSTRRIHVPYIMCGYIRTQAHNTHGTYILQ